MDVAIYGYCSISSKAFENYYIFLPAYVESLNSNKDIYYPIALNQFLYDSSGATLPNDLPE
jgi:hypothetical protein